MRQLKALAGRIKLRNAGDRLRAVSTRVNQIGDRGAKRRHIAGAGPTTKTQNTMLMGKARRMERNARIARRGAEIAPPKNGARRKTRTQDLTRQSQSEQGCSERSEGRVIGQFHLYAKSL
jgi:hypothetical protein